MSVEEILFEAWTAYRRGPAQGDAGSETSGITVESTGRILRESASRYSVGGGADARAREHDGDQGGIEDPGNWANSPDSCGASSSEVADDPSSRADRAESQFEEATDDEHNTAPSSDAGSTFKQAETQSRDHKERLEAAESQIRSVGWEDAGALHSLGQRLFAIGNGARQGLIDVLRILHDIRGFKDLGYSTFHAYCSVEYGIAKSTAYEYVRVSKALEELPLSAALFKEGQISWPQVREVAKVATAATERQWLELCPKLTLRKLVAEVKAARKAGRAAPRERRYGLTNLSVRTTIDLTLEEKERLRLGLALASQDMAAVPAKNLGRSSDDRNTDVTRGEPSGRTVSEPSARPATDKSEEKAQPADDGDRADVQSEPDAETGEPSSDPHGDERLTSVDDSIDIDQEERLQVNGPETGSEIKEVLLNLVDGLLTGKLRIAHCDEGCVCGSPIRVKSAVRLVYHDRPEGATVQTPDGRVRVPRSRLRAMADGAEKVTVTAFGESADDSDVGPLPPGVIDEPTTAKMQKEVLSRDGMRCSVPGCDSLCDLQVHHILFRSRGGRTIPANLVTICATCHSLVHLGLLECDGIAPDDLTWTRRPKNPSAILKSEAALSERLNRLEAELPKPRASSNGVPTQRNGRSDRTPAQPTPADSARRSSARAEQSTTADSARRSSARAEQSTTADSTGHSWPGHPESTADSTSTLYRSADEAAEFDGILRRSDPRMDIETWVAERIRNAPAPQGGLDSDDLIFDGTELRRPDDIRPSDEIMIEGGPRITVGDITGFMNDLGPLVSTTPDSTEAATESAQCTTADSHEAATEPAQCTTADSHEAATESGECTTADSPGAEAESAECTTADSPGARNSSRSGALNGHEPHVRRELIRLAAATMERAVGSIRLEELAQALTSLGWGRRESERRVLTAIGELAYAAGFFAATYTRPKRAQSWTDGTPEMPDPLSDEHVLRRAIMMN